MNTTPHWSADRQVAFDLETTGIDVHTDRIVTAAVVHHTPGERPRTLSWLIDPGTEIPTGASDVHGWTRDRIRRTLADDRFVAASFVGGYMKERYTEPAQALFEIAGQVALPMSTATPLVVFNAAFDLSLLEAECARHDVPTLTERLAPKPLAGVVDPFVIDKHYSRRKGSRKLTDQCSHYGVLHGGAHQADADALACLRLAARQVAAYPELAQRQLGWLHGQQASWRMQQQSSLAAYFNRVGKDHDGCCGSWPIHGDCCAPVAQGALL